MNGSVWWSRRELLRSSVFAAGILSESRNPLSWAFGPRVNVPDEFRGAKMLGTVGFTNEVSIPMGTKIGAELDGRLYTDLSELDARNPLTATDKFYLRTGASKLLAKNKEWTIQLRDSANRESSIPLSKLRSLQQHMGVHLMECAGNTREFHFGMVSTATWSGVPISAVLADVVTESTATSLLVSGFDRYQSESGSSVPGASWIFKLSELREAGAFLATEMNGQPLTEDHGAPVRLMMPGWYGCSCIKWVDEIRLVSDYSPATSQMREYAARTHQTGVPELARDYRAAAVQQAAIPIRLERWLVDGKINYRVIGIHWGGLERAHALEIRFNPEEEYVPVERFTPPQQNTWSFWMHTWSAPAPGTYLIRLRVPNLNNLATRLNAGYYVRSVEIN